MTPRLIVTLEEAKLLKDAGWPKVAPASGGLFYWEGKEPGSELDINLSVRPLKIHKKEYAAPRLDELLAFLIGRTETGVLNIYIHQCHKDISVEVEDVRTMYVDDKAYSGTDEAADLLIRSAVKAVLHILNDNAKPTAANTNEA